MGIHVDLDELLGSSVSPLPTADAMPLPGAQAVVPGSGNLSGNNAFEGSSTFDQMALWAPVMVSADSEILPEKQQLDARSRDMMRNDAFVAGGATLHKDNIVGGIYLLNAKPNSAVLFGKSDDTWETEFQEEVETKFTLWAESDQCWVDAKGTKTLTDIVRLAVGGYVATGEVLATAEWLSGGRPFQTAVQMVDPDRLSTPYGLANYMLIPGGVEIDDFGKPLAYHIRKVYPGEPWRQNYYDYNNWIRVEAKKPWGRKQVLHIFDELRPGQTRGISPMVAALQEMKMLKSFRKVELQRAVLAASYAASIESDLPPAEVFRAMGGDEKGSPALEYMKDYLNAIDQYTNAQTNKNLSIDGARIPVFMPGTKLNIKNPGAESPAGSQFEMSMLRYISAVLGVSYEQLSRDYTNTNYSSAKASRGETEKGMQAKKRKVADGTATFIYRLWLEEAVNRNQLETLKRKNVPGFYQGLNMEAYTACEWIGAGMGMIDPLKETQADVLAIKGGLETKERVIARRTGGDWRKIASQIAREKALDDKYGNPSIYDQQDTQQQTNALSGTGGTKAVTIEQVERLIEEKLEERA